MRTRVYIDGLNLYNGRLARTAFKWLDVVKLFDATIIPEQQPLARIEQVNFYSAPVLQRFSRSGTSEQRQQIYHAALQTLHPEQFALKLGAHIPTPVQQIRAAKPLNLADRVKVWRLEEKESDVRLALDMYRDASKNLVDLIVLCTNDSDLAPSLEMLREDFPNVEIGVVFPRAEAAGRLPSGKLRQHASWVRSYIRDEELSTSQLPPIVSKAKKGGRTKVYRKPAVW